VTNHQRIRLQQLVNDYRHSGVFSDAQIRTAASLLVRRLTPPEITDGDLQDFFRLNSMQSSRSRVVGQLSGAGQTRPPIAAKAVSSSSPVSSRPNINRKDSSPRTAPAEQHSSAAAITRAADVVGVSAAVAGAVAVIRNLLGSIKDSLDIVTHLRERPERGAKNGEESRTKGASTEIPKYQ
jgi:hypothetical protein